MGGKTFTVLPSKQGAVKDSSKTQEWSETNPKGLKPEEQWAFKKKRDTKKGKVGATLKHKG